MNAKERVRERVQSLPQATRDCEACGKSKTMQIRRSSLNKQFLADDVGLKCSNCRYYRTHGIPFVDSDEFDTEMKLRGRRVLDFTRDESGQPDKSNLEALGYLGASESL